MSVVPQAIGRFLFLGCFTLVPVSVFGEFSPLEKQQFLDQTDSMNSLTSAAAEMMGHLESHPRDARQIRRIVATLSGKRDSARSRQFHAMVWLAGGNVDKNRSRGRDFSDNATRRDVVLRAFRVLDSASRRYRRAENQILRLSARCRQDCTALDRALSYLREANAIYLSFDKTLPYAEPLPDVSLTATFDPAAAPARRDRRSLLEALESTEKSLERAWDRHNRAAVANPRLPENMAISGMNYSAILLRMGWALGLSVGAEHPRVVDDVEAVLAKGVAGASRELARLAVAEEVLSDAALALEGSGSRGRSDRNGNRPSQPALPNIPRSAPPSEKPPASVPPTPPSTPPTQRPSPPPRPSPPSPPYGPKPSDGVYDLLADNLPLAGEFQLLPGSAIGDVLVGDGEFPFCADIACRDAVRGFTAWVGMAFDEVNGRWWNAAGGGHADYGGNEIYLFDFRTFGWHRVTNPAPLTGPFMVDENDDGVADACPSPATGAPASHTYDGSLYVPSTDEILVVGTVPYCKNAMAYVEHGWVWSNATSSWRKLSTLGSTGYMRTLYDAVRDRVYMIGGHGHGQFYELDPHDDYAIVRDGPYLGWTNWGVAEFDESTRYLYYSAAKIGLYRIHIDMDGKLGPKELISRMTDEQTLPVGIHTPSGRIVTWAGDARVLRTDPDTGIVEDLTPSSGARPSAKSHKIYSKWVYIQAVDAFVGINNPRDGIWIYRLPESVALPSPTPRPSPAPSPAPSPSPAPAPPPVPAPTPAPGAASFEERCNAPGVVFCDPLDTKGPWGVDASGTRRLMPNNDGTEGIPEQGWGRNWEDVKKLVETVMSDSWSFPDSRT